MLNGRTRAVSLSPKFGVAVHYLSDHIVLVLLLSYILSPSWTGCIFIYMNMIHLYEIYVTILCICRSVSVMKSDREKVRTILIETIVALCNKGLKYNVEMSVEGLIGKFFLLVVICTIIVLI